MGYVFVLIEIKGIRNLENVKVFCQKATFSPKMHSTVTEVLLADKDVHSKLCVSISTVYSRVYFDSVYNTAPQTDWLTGYPNLRLVYTSGALF